MRSCSRRILMNLCEDRHGQTASTALNNLENDLLELAGLCKTLDHLQREREREREREKERERERE